MDEWIAYIQQKKRKKTVQTGSFPKVCVSHAKMYQKRELKLLMKNEN